MFDEDPISDDPGGDRKIDDAEFLSKEIWTTDLVCEALEVFNPLGQGGCLKLRGLRVKKAEVARHDELVDEITPDSGLSGLVWIGRPQMGFVLGVNIFEEFEDNVGVVKRFALICESGDESFGVEGYVSMVQDIGRWGVKRAQRCKIG